MTGLLGPLVVSRIGPRWSIVLAALTYPLWIASNLCVTGGVVFYLILLTISALVGVAQSMAWSGQVRMSIRHFFRSLTTQIFRGLHFFCDVHQKALTRGRTDHFSRQNSTDNQNTSPRNVHP